MAAGGAAAEGTPPLTWDWEGRILGQGLADIVGLLLDLADFAALQVASHGMQESLRNVIRARNDKLPEELRMRNLGGEFNVGLKLRELLKRERPRLLDIIATGGIVPGRGALNTVMRMDVVTKRCTALAPMTAARCNHATAVLNGKLFVMGGFSYGHLSSAECLDMETGEWSAVAPMGTPRSSTGAAALGGRIFVVGGFNRGQFLSSVRSFDPATGQWTAVAPLHTPRGGHGVVSVQGRLFAVGGEAVLQRGAEALKSVECFDPATGIWTLTDPLNEARKDVGVAGLGHKLFAIGGQGSKYCDLSSVECLDLSVPNGAWTLVAPMTVPRGNFGVAVTGGRIYAVGGEGETRASDSMECFDPNTAGPWTVMSEASPFQAAARIAAC